MTESLTFKESGKKDSGGRTGRRLKVTLGIMPDFAGSEKAGLRIDGVTKDGPMRAIFDVMGVRNVVAKSLGSSNPYNMVRATLNGLRASLTPSEVAAKRGKTVEEILG